MYFQTGVTDIMSREEESTTSLNFKGSHHETQENFLSFKTSEKPYFIKSNQKLKLNYHLSGKNTSTKILQALHRETFAKTLLKKEYNSGSLVNRNKPWEESSKTIEKLNDKFVNMKMKKYVDGIINNETSSNLSQTRFTRSTSHLSRVSSPQFIQEPPYKLHFSNSTGATLNCQVSASSIPPSIVWTTQDGRPVNQVRVFFLKTEKFLKFLCLETEIETQSKITAEQIIL